MNWYHHLITILLSGFIGWMITWVSTKILFHPRKPIRIFGYTIQGIFPKNQSQIAQKLGEVVSTELLPFSDIEQKITDPENLQKLKPEIEKHVDEFLNKKLKDVFPILSKFIGVKTTTQIKDAFMEELETMFPVMVKKYMTQLKTDIDLEKFVVEKVSGFSGEKLENILNRITKNELRIFELVGTVFGLIIGSIQVLFTIFV